MRRIYKWEQWLTAPRTILVRGVDYHCSQSTMAGMVRNNASMRGVRVRVVDNRDSIVIEVPHAVPHTDRATVAG